MIYKNVPFSEKTEAPTCLADIIRGVHKVTYDEVVYSDLSYPRFRTVTLDEETDVNIEAFTLEKLGCLFSAINLADGTEKTTESFKIPKKNGKWRTITAPTGEYKAHLTTLTSILNQCFMCTPDNAYAYVKGRCIMNAVNRHKNNNWFLKMDLTNFFGSITKETLTTQLKKTYPFAYLQTDAINKLVDFVTMDNVLPQGTPTSPVLTNIFMTEFDCKMQDYVNKINKENDENVVYTRYADDILISSKKKETIDDVMFIPQINMLLGELGLSINPEKTRIGSIAGRNWNLGLMLNKDHNITIGHNKTRKYKAMMYQTILRFKDGDTQLHFEFPEINGKLMWLKQVEPEYFEYLVKHYEEKTGVNYYTIQSSL